MVAQRTQAIESKVKLAKMDSNSIKILQVKDSIPWVRCASGNVLYLCWSGHAHFLKKYCFELGYKFVGRLTAGHDQF